MHTAFSHLFYYPCHAETRSLRGRPEVHGTSRLWFLGFERQSQRWENAWIWTRNTFRHITPLPQRWRLERRRNDISSVVKRRDFRPASSETSWGKGSFVLQPASRWKPWRLFAACGTSSEGRYEKMILSTESFWTFFRYLVDLIFFHSTATIGEKWLMNLWVWDPIFSRN